jgi:hypothetical protein
MGVIIGPACGGVHLQLTSVVRAAHPWLGAASLEVQRSSSSRKPTDLSDWGRSFAVEFDPPKALGFEIQGSRIEAPGRMTITPERPGPRRSPRAIGEVIASQTELFRRP